jgi:PAS domain S-box-containing protein
MDMSCAELVENDLPYRHFFERAVDGMLLATSQGRVLAVNAHACLILKRSREEMGLAGLDALFDPKDPYLEPARQEWQLAGSFKGELSLVRGDKETFPAEVSVAVCGDGGRELMGIVFRDMTERKQAEDELKESEERYRGLIELFPEAVMVHMGGRLLYINAAAAKLLGAASLKELVGRELLEFVHPDCQQMVAESTIRAQQEGKLVGPIEEKLVQLGGKVVDVEVAQVAVGYGGRAERWCG